MQNKIYAIESWKKAEPQSIQLEHPFPMSSFERYKGIFGCYTFWDDDECIYVGKATCVYSRVKSHAKRFGYCNGFLVFDARKYVKNMDHKNATKFLSFLESYLIFQFDPSENIKRPDIQKIIFESNHMADGVWPAFTEFLYFIGFWKRKSERNSSDKSA